MVKLVWPLIAAVLATPASLAAADLRLGIVGTDTSHVVAFTALLNDPSSPEHVAGARVVAAFKGGSPDIAASRDRIDGFTRTLQDKYGVEIVPTIEELCRRVDGVILTSNDGRVHLAQAREILAARKPMFIDKPLASTLDDAREIARLAKAAGVPWFSTSSLRYGVDGLKAADLSGVDVWGPGPLEEHHQLDLSWYAIHEAEILYTLLGTGCEEVTRVASANADIVACRWKDGRIGTMRALRPYSDYGVIVFHADAKEQKGQFSAPASSYTPLVREIVTFFQTGIPPVPNEETLELFAFMDAAQRSKEAGGRPMALR
jgi:Oxidoreductase family, NAD-binding Rossmann fold